MKQTFKCNMCDSTKLGSFKKKFKIFPFNNGKCTECKDGILKITDNIIVEKDLSQQRTYDDRKFNLVKYQPQQHLDNNKKMLSRKQMKDYL